MNEEDKLRENYKEYLKQYEGLAYKPMSFDEWRMSSGEYVI